MGFGTRLGLARPKTRLPATQLVSSSNCLLHKHTRTTTPNSLFKMPGPVIRLRGMQLKEQPRVGLFTAERMAKFPVTLGLWGAGAAVAVSLFMSTVPLFKHDVLDKVPFVRNYFVDKTPDSDKPF